jgi:hypothetical protein
VAATNRRLTALRLVPVVAVFSGTSSSDPAYRRVETPSNICYRGQRRRPGADHELTQVPSHQLVQRQRQLRLRRIPCSLGVVPGSLLHRRLLLGKHPEIPLGANSAATSIFNRARDYTSM